MKKLIYLLFFASLIFTSCRKEAQLKEMETVFNSEIGKMVDGKFEFTVTKESILASTKEMPTSKELNLKPKEVKIEEIEGKQYLRIYSDNDYVSTIALKFDSEGARMMTEGTSCTSKDCASGGGCVPNGQYCTKCVKGESFGSPIYGDCLRTTSSENMR